MNNLGDYPGKKTSGFLKQWQKFIYFRFFLRSNCKSDFWRVHWLRSQVWEVDPDPTNWQSSAPPPVLTFNLITISEPFWGFGVKIARCTSHKMQYCKYNFSFKPPVLTLNPISISEVFWGFGFNIAILCLQSFCTEKGGQTRQYLCNKHENSHCKSISLYIYIVDKLI